MIEGRAVWEAAKRLNLYALSNEELKALIAAHEDDPVVIATARYIVEFRRGLTSGETC